MTLQTPASTGPIQNMSATAVGGTSVRTLAQKWSGCDVGGSNCTLFDLQDYGVSQSNSGTVNRNAIQAAVNTACAVGLDQAKLVFPGGKIPIDTTAGDIIINCFGITIAGRGAGTTQINWTPGGNNLFHFMPAAGQTNVGGVSIEDIRLGTLVSNTTAGAAILLDRAFVVHISNVWIDNTYTGIDCWSCFQVTAVNGIIDGRNNSPGSSMWYFHKYGQVGNNPTSIFISNFDMSGNGRQSAETYECILKITDSDGIEFAASHIFGGARATLCVWPEAANSHLGGLDLSGLYVDEGGWFGTDAPGGTGAGAIFLDIPGFVAGADSFSLVTSGGGNSGGIVPVSDTSKVIPGQVVTGTGITHAMVGTTIVTNTSIPLVDQTTGLPIDASSVTSDETIALAITLLGDGPQTMGFVRNADHMGLFVSDSHLNGMTISGKYSYNNQEDIFINHGSNIAIDARFENSPTRQPNPHITITGNAQFLSINGAAFPGPGATGNILYDIGLFGGNHIDISRNSYQGDYTTAPILVDFADTTFSNDWYFDEIVRGIPLRNGTPIPPANVSAGITMKDGSNLMSGQLTAPIGSTSASFTFAPGAIPSTAPNCTWSAGPLVPTNISFIQTSATGLEWTYSSLSEVTNITYHCDKTATGAIGP